jgi:TonB-dependent Receptor Plug Domain/CarboxypepD_reg-like domain
MRYLFSISLFLLLLSASQLHAQTGMLDQPLTLNYDAQTLPEILDAIVLVLPISFSYDSRILPTQTLTGGFQQVPLRKALDALLKPLRLDWELKGNIVVLRAAPQISEKSYHIISGYVEDGQTGERLVGAQVYDMRTKQGTLSNEAGFFSLRLKADSVKLVVSMLGYAVHGERCLLRQDLRRVVRLKSDFSLETVVITDQDQLDPMKEAGASIIEVSMSDLARLPALMGETDVINVLKMFPGVHSGGDGAQGFYVRGGGADQNLVLLDGATVYNSSHLFGFYSIFNSDVIKDVRLVKGGFPARYGGRLSSVVDIQMKDGNLEKVEGSANLGLVSAKLAISIPIIKGKTSLMLSGRRTILEPYFAAINYFSIPLNGNRLGYSFLDLQGKLQHVLGPKDRLLLSGYVGGDRFASGYAIDTAGVNNEFKFGLRWSNAVASLQWRHEWNQQMFSNLSVLFSQYKYTAESKADLHFEGEPNISNRLRTISSVQDLGLRWSFDLMPDCHNWLRFGAAATGHIFEPEKYSQLVSGAPIDSFSTDLSQPEIRSLESMAWIEDQVRLGKRFNINLGLHFSDYFVDSSFFWSLQPRVSARLTLPYGIGLQGSFTDMVQYIHLLSNAGVGLPTDLWVPATGAVPPQRSQQYAVGLDKKFGNGGWVISAEGYYKRMTDLIDYQTGVNFIGNSDWQDLVEKGGVGWSRGLEVLLRKNAGRFTGWLGYTLSKTERQFTGINFGERYPYKYDRRHDLSTAFIFSVNAHVELSATWMFATGTAITFPEAVYYAPSASQLGFWDLNQGKDLDVIIDYGSRNSFRLPAYHRLDLNVKLLKKVKWGETFWNFGIFNVYNRRNPYFLFLRADYSKDSNSPEIKVRKMSLLPILPEVNFGLKF